MTVLRNGLPIGVSRVEHREILETAHKKKWGVFFLKSFHQTLLPAAEALCRAFFPKQPEAAFSCTLPLGDNKHLYLFHRIPYPINKTDKSTIAVIHDHQTTEQVLFFGLPHSEKTPFALFDYRLATHQSFCAGNLGCLVAKLPEKIDAFLRSWQVYYAKNLKELGSRKVLKAYFTEAFDPAYEEKDLWKRLVSPYFSDAKKSVEVPWERPDENTLPKKYLKHQRRPQALNSHQ